MDSPCSESKALPSTRSSSSFSSNASIKTHQNLLVVLASCALPSPFPKGPVPQSALHLHPFRISSHSYSMFLVTEHGHTLSYLTANCEVSRAGIKSTLLEATGAQGGDFPRPPAHVYQSGDVIQACSPQSPCFPDYSLKLCNNTSLQLWHSIIK